jgi:hypothetical protein
MWAKSSEKRKDGTTLTKAETGAKQYQKVKQSHYHHYPEGQRSKKNMKIDMKTNMRLNVKMKVNVKKGINENIDLDMNMTMNVKNADAVMR